jgi:hypothetical protein
MAGRRQTENPYNLIFERGIEHENFIDLVIRRYLETERPAVFDESAILIERAVFAKLLSCRARGRAAR